MSYKAITVTYQAINCATGIVVQMDVYNPSGVKDVAKSHAMTEIATTGRYNYTFTPDVVGVWTAEISDGNGGKAVKGYDAVTTSVDDLATSVATVDSKVTGQAGDISTLVTGNTDTQGKLDDIGTKVTAFAAPPMIG